MDGSGDKAEGSNQWCANTKQTHRAGRNGPYRVNIALQSPFLMVAVLGRHVKLGLRTAPDPLCGLTAFLRLEQAT